MEFKIQIPNERVYLLGEDPSASLQTLAEREITRLWHVERSKPRGYAPGKPGRPRAGADAKALKLLAAEVLPIYDKLKTMYGEKDFNRIYGHQYTQVVDMIEDKDLEGLRQWLSAQPWTKRGQ